MTAQPPDDANPWVIRPTPPTIQPPAAQPMKHARTRLPRLERVDRFTLIALVLMDLGAGLYLQATLTLHGLGQIGTVLRPYIAVALWVAGALVLYHVIAGRRHRWSDELLLINAGLQIMTTIEMGFTDGRTTEVRTALALILLASTIATLTLWLRIFVLRVTALPTGPHP